MDTTDYIKHCDLVLNDREFYEKLDTELNPTLISIEEVKQKLMIYQKITTKRNRNITFLAEN